jgi:hypothetical protein
MINIVLPVMERFPEGRETRALSGRDGPIRPSAAGRTRPCFPTGSESGWNSFCPSLPFPFAFNHRLYALQVLKAGEQSIFQEVITTKINPTTYLIPQTIFLENQCLILIIWTEAGGQRLAVNPPPRLRPASSQPTPKTVRR